jgi:hypothetical protein
MIIATTPRLTGVSPTCIGTIPAIAQDTIAINAQHRFDDVDLSAHLSAS